MDYSTMTTEELEYILRHMDRLVTENETKRDLLNARLLTFKKQGEVISMEEAIQAASLSSVTYEEKVQSSGRSDHDEIYQILKESRKAYQIAVHDLNREYAHLIREYDKYTMIRGCIARMGIMERKYIENYYMKDLTRAEGQDLFEVSVSTFYRGSTKALNMLHQMLEEEYRSRNCTECCGFGA